MPDRSGPNPIQINKYPNRRLYDTVGSRHVTLDEVHDLIVSGKDVCVTDTKTGEDLTNVVLMQILLEKDHLKLDLFPSSIMHMMIRSNRRALRDTFERFFGPFLGIMAAGQKQFDAYLRETMKGQMMSPMDWTNGVLGAFGGDRAVHAGAARSAPGQAPPTNERSAENGGDLDELRAQLESLQRRVSQLDKTNKTRPRAKR